MFSNDLTKSYPETIKFLTNAILKGQVANSYLYIGKDTKDIFSIVVNLAKILNCSQRKNPNSPPCEKCINCKWLEKNQHPQALLIINPDKSSKKEQIKIDTIRDLLNTLSTTSDYFRVIFFENSNLNSLPTESCNLLLKIVEETPEKTIFIFANSTKNDILPTIVSRSQTIYVNKKHDAPFEIINNKIDTTNKDIFNCFSKDTQNALEKTKQTLVYLENHEIELKDHLISLASINYNTVKHLNLKQYCYLYKHLSIAYSKHKSFMQPKIVIEDLFLNLIE